MVYVVPPTVFAGSTVCPSGMSSVRVSRTASICWAARFAATVRWVLLVVRWMVLTMSPATISATTPKITMETMTSNMVKPQSGLRRQSRTDISSCRDHFLRLHRRGQRRQRDTAAGQVVVGERGRLGRPGAADRDAGGRARRGAVVERLTRAGERVRGGGEAAGRREQLGPGSDRLGGAAGAGGRPVGDGREPVPLGGVAGGGGDQLDVATHLVGHGHGGCRRDGLHVRVERSRCGGPGGHYGLADASGTVCRHQVSPGEIRVTGQVSAVQAGGYSAVRQRAHLLHGTVGIGGGLLTLLPQGHPLERVDLHGDKGEQNGDENNHRHDQLDHGEAAVVAMRHPPTLPHAYLPLSVVSV